MLTDNPILIKAAEKNYHVFKTPTNLVESTKLKRYYTAEQLSDLDVKTSVNKIGEIVNLSQVLNSMYWDKLHHGATHEELHELYCDASTLDVMSNLEIDKAKKEFAIDNAVELNMLRKKYEDVLTTDDEKKILPSFFAHISRQKGYYDPKRKAYIPHDTSMDYLQTIVKRFKTKHPLAKPTSKLIDVFDRTKYHVGNVNKKQVSHIMKYVKEYNNKMISLYSDTHHLSELPLFDDGTTRYERQQMYYEELVTSVNKYRLGYSTMIFLLKLLEEPSHRKYKNILLPLLFTLCRQSFVEAIKENIKEIELLEEPGEDIKLFDFSFKITKKGKKTTC